MRVSIKFTLPLAAVLFGLLLVPRGALAGTSDCPVEPTQNAPLTDGETLIGTNCTINAVGDIDSFVFDGTSGDTYRLTLGINGSAPTNICMTIYSPSFTQIYNSCTSIGYPNEQYAIVTDQTLTESGSFTVDVTETSTNTIGYALSLERVYPFPPNAQPLVLNKVATGDIAEITDANAFTFGVVTTGEYEVSATLTGSVTSNLCMNVYQTNGASAFSGCTSIGYPNELYTVEYTFTPPQAGTYMAFLTVAGNDGTATYNMELGCVVGNCVPPPPSCALTDSLSYASGTLTMNFTVENGFATTWNIWLIDENSAQSLYSAAQPITNTPTNVTKTAAVSPAGRVGVLSTLTTPTKGIACSSWVQIGSGTP